MIFNFAEFKPGTDFKKLQTALAEKLVMYADMKEWAKQVKKEVENKPQGIIGQLKEYLAKHHPQEPAPKGKRKPTLTARNQYFSS